MVSERSLTLENKHIDEEEEEGVEQAEILIS